MSDMPCICEMSMIEDNIELEQDILSGRAMDILLCMMDHAETSGELARRIGIPIYSVQLYLQRLINAKLIREQVRIVSNEEVEKTYHLVSDDINIISRIENMSEVESKRKSDISAQHFALMTRNAIKNVNLNVEKPHKIKAYFMKAKKEDMQKFCDEIQLLFEKYQSLEDTDQEDTYSLFTVLAPYKVEE